VVWVPLALIVLALLFFFFRRREPEPIIATRSTPSDPIIKDAALSAVVHEE
jgi:hypothetical protein